MQVLVREEGRGPGTGLFRGGVSAGGQGRGVVGGKDSVVAGGLGRVRNPLRGLSGWAVSRSAENEDQMVVWSQVWRRTGIGC